MLVVHSPRIVCQIEITDADIFEFAIEQVATMKVIWGHFAVPGIGGISGAIHANGNIFTHGLPGIPCSHNPLGRRGPIGSGMREKVILCHILTVARCRAAEFVIQRQYLAAAQNTIGIGLFQHLLDFIQAGVGCAAG
jgi:hypothetical protein